jgi:hypothetical protein
LLFCNRKGEGYMGEATGESHDWDSSSPRQPPNLPETGRHRIGNGTSGNVKIAPTPRGFWKEAVP